MRGISQRPAVRSSGELLELEGILMYVECVTASLSHRARAPAPPEEVLSVQSSVVPPRRGESSELRGGSPQCSVAMGLHDASNSLLSWFSRLEYVSLSASLTLKDIEKNLNTAASDTGAALDAIERRYGSHEVPDVREFFVGSRLTIEECRRVTKSLQQLAQRLVAIRRVVVVRDQHRAKQLFAEFKKQHSNSEAPNRTGNSPIITWIESKWFPAINAWNQIITTARDRAAAGDVDGAIAAAQQRLLSENSVLSEILQPGETLSELLREQLEVPLAQMGESFKQKNKRIEALRMAIATVRTADLADCVCAAEELAAAGQLTEVEQGLLKEGKKLIIRVQQVSNVEAALRLAAEVGETVTLFRSIHQANCILLDLRIAGDVRVNTEVVRHCGALLTEMESTRNMSPNEFIARRVDPTRINIAHVPSMLWAASTTAAYQSACQCFTARTAKDLARLDLGRVLDTAAEDPQHANNLSLNRYPSRASHTSQKSFTSNSNLIASSGDEGSNPSTAPALAVDSRFARMPSQMSPAQMRELRMTLDRARQAGVNGPMIHQGEARLLVAEALRIKVHFEAQLRVLRVTEPQKATFDHIYEKLVALCSQQTEVLPRPPGQRLRIRYQDSDGDNISIVSQEDWNAFVAENAPAGLCGARLELYCDFPPLPQPREADVLLTPGVPEPISIVSPNSPPPCSAGSNRSRQQQQQQQQVTSHSNSATPQRTAPAAARPKVQLPAVTSSQTGNGVLQFMRLTRSRSAGFALSGRSGIQISRQITPVRRTSADDSGIQCRVPRLLLSDPQEDQLKENQLQENKQNQQQQQKALREKEAAGQPTPQPISASNRQEQPPNPAAPAKMALKPRRQSPVLGRVRCTERSAISANANRLKRSDDDVAKSRLIPPQVSTPGRAQPAGGVEGGEKREAAEAPNVKRWCDDEDRNLELRTVLSVNTSVQPPSSSVSAKKSPVVPRRANKFTVTPIPRVGGSQNKPADRQEKPQAMAQTGPIGEKREWKEDVFTMSDICTVASESTTPAASFTNRARAKQQGSPFINNATQQQQQQHQHTQAQRPVAASAAVTTSDVDAAADLKKKSEALRQLKQLREENQKALKVALDQRKINKS